MALISALTASVPQNHAFGGVYSIEVSAAATAGGWWTVQLSEFIVVERIQWSVSAGTAQPAVTRAESVAGTNTAAVASSAGATGDESFTGKTYYASGGAWFIHPQVSVGGSTVTLKILCRRWEP